MSMNLKLGGPENKLEQIKAAIERIPNSYPVVRTVSLNLLDQGELRILRSYLCGASDMAYELTSDEDILVPLREARRLLR